MIKETFVWPVAIQLGELLYKEIIANPHSITPLMREYISHRATLKYFTAQCDTSLMAAVRNKNLAQVQMIVEAGADLELSNSYDERALSIACQHSTFEIVRYLVSKGANYERAVNGVCAIDWCSKSYIENTQKLRFFMSKNVRCNYKKEYGETYYSCLYCAWPNPQKFEVLDLLVPYIYNKYGSEHLIPKKDSFLYHKRIGTTPIPEIIQIILGRIKLQEQTPAQFRFPNTLCDNHSVRQLNKI